MLPHFRHRVFAFARLLLIFRFVSVARLFRLPADIDAACRQRFADFAAERLRQRRRPLPPLFRFFCRFLLRWFPPAAMPEIHYISFRCFSPAFAIFRFRDILPLPFYAPLSSTTPPISTVIFLFVSMPPPPIRRSPQPCAQPFDIRHAAPSIAAADTLPLFSLRSMPRCRHYRLICRHSDTLMPRLFSRLPDYGEREFMRYAAPARPSARRHTTYQRKKKRRRRKCKG